MRKTAIAALATLSTAAAAFGAVSAPETMGPPDRAQVFVTSQGVFYDTIVLGELPPKGRFQLLEMDADGTLFTEFGPGDVGYLGGRWMADFDGDGVFTYFLCPLIPSGD